MLGSSGQIVRPDLPWHISGRNVLPGQVFDVPVRLCLRGLPVRFRGQYLIDNAPADGALPHGYEQRLTEPVVGVRQAGLHRLPATDGRCVPFAHGNRSLGCVFEFSSFGARHDHKSPPRAHRDETMWPGAVIRTEIRPPAAEARGRSHTLSHPRTCAARCLHQDLSPPRYSTPQILPLISELYRP
jgi:hypothetical protein